MLRPPAMVALLTLAACAGPPGPREARIAEGAFSRPTTVQGVVGAELTLEEIRRGAIEPRCAEAGLMMMSLRVKRRPDGAQDITARCGAALLAR